MKDIEGLTTRVCEANQIRSGLAIFFGDKDEQGNYPIFYQPHKMSDAQAIDALNRVKVMLMDRIGRSGVGDNPAGTKPMHLRLVKRGDDST